MNLPDTIDTRIKNEIWFRLFWLRKMLGHTERVMGPTWEVRSCLMGPALRNSLLGVIIQKPTDGALEESTLIHPWTLLSLFSHEYWYLSSTWAQHNSKTQSFHSFMALWSSNQQKVKTAERKLANKTKHTYKSTSSSWYKFFFFNIVFVWTSLHPNC